MSTEVYNIKLIKTDSLFLEKIGNIIDNEWYHIPFWFKKISDGVYEQYSFDQIPESLKSTIRGIREQSPDSTQKNNIQSNPDFNFHQHWRDEEEDNHSGIIKHFHD